MNANLSHSAKEAYDLCPRKWWYASVLRTQVARSAAAVTGQQVHAELEHRGKTGEWREPDLSKGRPIPLLIAQAAAADLPDFEGEGWEIEGRVELPPTEGRALKTKGFIDIWRYDEATKTLHVWDYKTTGSETFRWSKTAEELAENPQLCAYAKMLVELGKCPLPEAVSFRHINICTQPYAYRKVDGDYIPKFRTMSVQSPPVRWEVVEMRWREMQDTGRQMKGWLDKAPASPDEIPADTTGCSAFGGCPFQDQCSAFQAGREDHSTPVALPKGLPTRNKTMNERLAAIQAQIRGEKPAPKAPSKPAPAVEESPAEAAKDAAVVADTPALDGLARLVPAFDGLARLVTATATSGKLSKTVAEAMAADNGTTLDALLEATGLVVENGYLTKPAKKAAPKAPAPAEPEALTAEDLRALVTLDQGGDDKPSYKAMRDLGKKGLIDEAEEITAAGRAALASMTPPADEPAPSAPSAPSGDYSDVASAAVAEWLKGFTSRINRNALRDQVLAVDTSVSRVRIERMEAILEEVGGWRVSKDRKWVEPIAATPAAPAPSEPAPAPAADFEAELGWGTSEKMASAWAEENGSDLAVLLDAIGGQVLYGMVLPSDWEGTQREAYETFRTDASEILAVMDAADPPATKKATGGGDLGPQVPTKAKVTEKAPPAKATEPEPEPAPPQGKAAPAESPAPAVAPDEERLGTLLFLDVMPPIGFDAMTFDLWLTPFVDEVCARGGKVNNQTKVPLDHWNELDYNRGAATVAALISVHLRAEGIGSVPNLLIPGQHPLRNEVVALLESKGALVFKAVR